MRAGRTVTAMTTRETRAVGAWSIQRTSVRIMWSLIIGGLLAAIIGSSGTSATVAVLVMVISYFALTAFARRR